MWKTIFIVLSASLQTLSLNTNETEGELFLEKYNDLVATLWNEDVKAAWNYYTNLTTENLQIMTDSSLKTSEFAKNIATVNASAFDWTRFGNDTRRKFQKIVSIGFAATNDTEKLRQISSLEAELTSIYSTGEVCLNEFGKGCLQLEPGLTDIITTSRDYEELLAVWKGWRDATGKKMRNKYTQFVNVMNDAIKFSGYKDTGEYWRSWYETPSFEDDVRKLYEELAPLYQELHAYVRRKLMNKYGEALFPKTGHIPAHLFGNMWAQQWSNVFDLLVPYPDASSVDITAKMKELGYNETYMYRVAEEFFESIGMDPMTSEFWENSMLVKPEGRNVVCHASAWDFYDGKDFRIKQCTSVTEDQLLTVHHEMGHIVYFQNYKVQPRIYRSGANPGFHEGMADIVSLSFQTPEHMKAIGLIDEIPEDDKSDINFLMKMALDKVAFLPFGYLIDQWRWSVFRGETNISNYNANWWDLRCSFQGISPPVLRSEEDFDAGAKYHIPGNTPYIRYFVSFIIQFQWHKALCDEINYTGPLHRCDIYRNKTAGDLLKKMLVMGSSKPWQDAMEVMTGERVMSAQPLMNYFAPLLTWLKEQNKQENVGWSSSCPTAIPTPTSMPIIPSSSSVIGSCKFLLFILLCLLADLIC